jgi:hypothetical protein
VVWQGTTPDGYPFPVYDVDYSPDGEKVVFSSIYPNFEDQEIFVVDSSGGTPVQLTHNSSSDEAPTWSPDSTKIAFSGVRDNDADILVMNADGSNESRLHMPGAQMDPSWQPIPQQYVRPKSAGPLWVSLVPAANKCLNPNRQHGPPLAYASCNPPTIQQFTKLTVGTQMTGLARYVPIAGNPVTPADEADVAVRLTVSDVRRQDTLEDYGGEVEVRSTLRLTDRANGPATMFGVFLVVPAPCTATADTSVGSTCSVNTTLDALFPGAIAEGARSVFELGQVQVYDGGSDDDADTQPNYAFLRQGIFVP